jgi:TIGR03009 family protein
MSFRVSSLLSLAIAMACTSATWAQTAPGNPSARPARGPGGTGTEFRWSDEEPKPRPRQPVLRTPAEGPAVRPTSGEAADNALIRCPWEPLTAQQQQFLDRLMATWEQHSSKIERYKCNFERWEYDPIFGPKDPQQSKTYGKGRLLYASPDKGLFEVQELSVYAPPAEPGAKPSWLKRPKEEIGEHWVCDGKSIFEFDARGKKLIQRELPPEMHGKAIVDGPLPFLFGAKADRIKARYWLRVITPTDVQGEHWIEASPKFQGDAKNFKMVHVIIDEKDFLPKAIQVFDPNFDPQTKQIRSVYTFKDREYNWNVTLQMLNLFHREFYEPRTPLGWTKVVEPFFPAPGEKQPAADNKTPTAEKQNPLKLPFKLR